MSRLFPLIPILTVTRSLHVVVFLAEAILKFFGLGSDLFVFVESVDILLTFVAVFADVAWYFIDDGYSNNGENNMMMMVVVVIMMMMKMMVNW